MAKDSLAKMEGGPTLPAWMQTMRAAAQSAVSEDDIKEIVKNQVAKAKAGDKNAIKFVFDQVLGGAALRGATIIQNNFSDGERPDSPTDAVPGSKKKLDVIAKRVAAGNGAFDKRDREGVNLD